jgi:hypothetical protein
MRCEEAGRIIQLAEDGRASAAERDRLQEHVAGCGACRRVQEGHRNLLRLLAAAPARELRAGFEERLSARIAAQPAASPVNAWWRRAQFRLSWRLLPTVATAGVAAGLAVWTILPERHPETPSLPPQATIHPGVNPNPAEHYESAQYQELVDYSIAQSTHGSISETD